MTRKNFLKDSYAITGILAVILSFYLPYYAFNECVSYYYVNKNGETINGDATKIIWVNEQTYSVLIYLVVAASIIDPFIVGISFYLISIPVYSAINQLK